MREYVVSHNTCAFGSLVVNCYTPVLQCLYNANKPQIAMTCRPTLRTGIVIGSTVQALVILAYYLFASDGQSISSMLSSDPVYRSLLSLCVVLLFALCFAHAYYNRRGANEILLVVGMVSWIMLNVYYLDANGTLLLTHIVAAGCYIAATGLYLVLVFLHETYSMLEMACILIGSLIAITIATTGAAVVCFFTKRTDTWLFEHAAFALFNITHALLLTFSGDDHDDPFFMV
jgi:hypothetical protein